MNRSHMLRIDPRRANPRDGRLNHGYSNYDEIWTWIPIIRGTEGDCSRSTVYATPSSNDLQPPSYNEVVGSSAPRPAAASSQSVVRQPGMTATHPHNPVSISISATLPPVPIASTREVVVSQTQEEPSLQNTCHSVTVRNPQAAVRGADSDQNAASSSTEHRRNTDNRNQIQQDSQSVRGRLQDNDFDRNNTTRQNVRARNYNSPYLARARNQTGTNASASRATDIEDDYRDVIYHPDQGLYSFTTSEGGRRAWCDIPPSLLNEDGPPPYTPAPDYPGRHHNTRRTSYRAAVNEVSPRYSRRSHRRPNDRSEIPPADYPISDQDCSNRQTEQVWGNISAPIVRYPCTCTLHSFVCRLLLLSCQCSFLE